MSEKTIQGSTVPGLEDIQYKEGSAVHIAIGAAQVWHKKATVAYVKGRAVGLGIGLAVAAVSAIAQFYLR
jgi:hypothetical protein